MVKQTNIQTTEYLQRKRNGSLSKEQNIDQKDIIRTPGSLVGMSVLFYKLCIIQFNFAY